MDFICQSVTTSHIIGRRHIIIILTAGAMRPDNIAMPLPKGLAGAAAKMAITKMIEHGWLQEVDAPSSRGEPLWRETGDGHGTTLVVTDAGLLAIGIEPIVVKTMTAIHKHAAEPPSPKLPTPRSGTKQAILISLLKAPEGATMEAMITATCWKPHYADVRIMPMWGFKPLFLVGIAEKGAA